MDFRRRHNFGLNAALAMAGIFLAAALTLAAGPLVWAAAGINGIIQYQAKVTDSAGTALADGTYDFKFRIMNAASGGTELWAEIYDTAVGNGSPVTVTSGVMTVDLGTVTALTGVDFNSDALYLEVQFDPGKDGTFEEVFSPRRRLTAAPYAFNADLLDGLNSTGFFRDNADFTSSGALTLSKAGTALSVTNSASIGTLTLTNALGVASGGTGAATFTANWVLYGNAANALQVTAAGTSG